MKVWVLEFKAEICREPSIILYGGSFDPPHEGHRRLIEQAQITLPNAKIWVLPALVPAGANALHKKPQASFKQRMDMCRLAFAQEVAQGRVLILDLEAQLPTPNYTVQTLRYCQKQYPEQRWALLIGEDQLASFAAWQEAASILALADILVVGRGQNGNLLQTAMKTAQQLGLELQPRNETCYGWKNLPSIVYLIGSSASEAASSVIRNNLSQALQKAWLAPAVAEYIQHARLYA